jgi:predicted RNase H-like HicB family nuclease
MSPPRIWKIKFPVTLCFKISFGADGYFVSEFPALPGCMSQGKTYDEAILNLAKAIQSVLEVKMKDGGSDVAINS